MTATEWISIPNPDDEVPMEPPIYEGDSDGAYRELIPGNYLAVDENDVLVTVVVTETGSYIDGREPAR